MDTVTSTQRCELRDALILPKPKFADNMQDLWWVIPAKRKEKHKKTLRTRLIPFPGNENEVGLGIRDSGVPREEIFLTSKLWNTHQPNVKEGLQKTLDALGVDYLDLYVSLRCAIFADGDAAAAVAAAKDTNKP